MIDNIVMTVQAAPRQGRVPGAPRSDGPLARCGRSIRTRLCRHPVPIEAQLEHSLVLTYAFPGAALEPLLPPGQALDTYRGSGFLAVAMVQTRDLRPAGFPRVFGQDFILAGYRIFTTLKHAGRTRRGLRILRSDANRRRMVFSGNLLTHYHYHLCSARFSATADRLEIEIRTPDGCGDVAVSADLSAAAEALPPGSPFQALHDARRFAGPLPYTFDYEAQTHSTIAIKGVRRDWAPRLVPVDVGRLTFLDQPIFSGAAGVLASAFYVHHVPYRWLRGVRIPLQGAAS